MIKLYKSFIRKKSTKLYSIIFIVLSIILSLSIITKAYLIKEVNKAYINSYLYFISKENINFNKFNNIKSYNKTIKVKCENSYIELYITDQKAINNYDLNKECIINNQIVKYSDKEFITIIENKELYNSLTQKEFHYFIKLKDWQDKENIIKELNKKNKIDVKVIEIKEDSNDYDNPLSIIKLFIKVIIVLFIFIFIITISNIIIDEQKNNSLYHYLGYSKIRISFITINKILLLIIIPLLIFLISLSYSLTIL